MKAFHGTSLKNALALVNGSTDKDTGIWSVSDNDGAFYVYPANKRLNDLGYDEDEFQDVLPELMERCKGDAMWHGQAATCHAPTDETTFVILEMTIPDELLQDDFSCPNMSDIASFIDLDQLHQVTFDALHVGKLSVYHRPFVLSGVIDNTECFTDSEIDPDLLVMAQLVADGEHYAVIEAIQETETECLTLEAFLVNYAPC